ncbi:hypothetical protein [uncultured archaeal virus]|uniref:Uncharacterized protein n=1 Tax=uncultured archaeal virus TaxID=1960247 RepID=A0A8B0LQ05_9VIRU|nr:hypothetical protein [uncultured archaeal virus]
MDINKEQLGKIENEYINYDYKRLEEIYYSLVKNLEEYAKGGQYKLYGKKIVSILNKIKKEISKRDKIELFQEQKKTTETQNIEKRNKAEDKKKLIFAKILKKIKTIIPEFSAESINDVDCFYFQDDKKHSKKYLSLQKIVVDSYKVCFVKYEDWANTYYFKIKNIG